MPTQKQKWKSAETQLRPGTPPEKEKKIKFKVKFTNSPSHHPYKKKTKKTTKWTGWFISVRWFSKKKKKTFLKIFKQGIHTLQACAKNSSLRHLSPQSQFFKGLKANQITTYFFLCIMKMWTHFKGKEKQLNQKEQSTTTQKLWSDQSEYKPATWRRDRIFSGSKC